MAESAFVGGPVIAAGMRVRVSQQIPQGGDAWASSVEGTVVRLRQAVTGSWYAHARGDRLWLDRLELRLDDGESVVVALDENSRVDVLSGPTVGAGTAGAGEKRSDAPPEDAGT